MINYLVVAFFVTDLFYYIIEAQLKFGECFDQESGIALPPLQTVRKNYFLLFCFN